MLKKISLKISPFVTHPRFFFAQQGFRKTYERIVETDPIYPDLKDSNRSVYRAPHRAPPVQREKKLATTQIHMANYVMKRTMNRFRTKSSFKAQDQQAEADEITQNILKEIKIDPVLKLPYGFTFDDYIVNTRQEKVARESSHLERLVTSIFAKLKVRNEIELAMLHKYVFAQKDGENFRERARKVVLQKFLKELTKLRKEDSKKIEKTVERYFEDFESNREFYLATLKDLDISNEDEIFKKLSPKMKPAKVEIAAQSMSLDVLERNVEEGEAKLLKEYKPGYRDKVSFDKLFFGTPVTTSCDEEASDPRQDHYYSYKVQMMNEEEFENYQLWRDVKKNYFKNKAKFYEKKQEIEEKGETLDQINEEGKEDLEAAAKNINLENFYAKPDFKEIYDNVDNLVLNMPITKEDESKSKKSDIKNPNYSPDDFLWSKVTDKFEKVIPRKYYEREGGVQAMQEDNPLILGSSLIDGFLSEDTMGNFKFERNIFDESVLTKDERLELAIFRQVRKDPFFHHHLTNNLKYFSERMLESSLAMNNMTSPGNPNRDYLNYLDPSDEIKERQFMERMSELEKEAEKNKRKTQTDKFFCGGRRKTAHAMAMVSPGRGIVKVNHLPIYKYFHEQFHRSFILRPVDIAKISCLVDVEFFVRGGGISAQVKSCQMALARCLVKRNPLLKTLFKKLLLIQADRRQVERKHVGHYKARKKFPYKRR